MRLIPILAAYHWPVCHGAAAKTEIQAAPSGRFNDRRQARTVTPTKSEGQHRRPGVAPAPDGRRKPLR